MNHEYLSNGASLDASKLTGSIPIGSLGVFEGVTGSIPIGSSGVPL